MTIINLRKYYPELYSSDYKISVPDEVAAALQELKREEAAARLRTYRAKAYYSLDRGDQIEREALYRVLAPHELLEKNIKKELLYDAIDSLPDKQAKRIYARYFLGMSVTEIAKAEGVGKGRITKSIKAGLLSIGEYFENFR